MIQNRNSLKLTQELSKRGSYKLVVLWMSTVGTQRIFISYHKCKCWASEMAHQVSILAAEYDNFNLNLRAQMVEKDDTPSSCYLTSTQIPRHLQSISTPCCTHGHEHKIKQKCNWNNKYKFFIKLHHKDNYFQTLAFQ